MEESQKRISPFIISSPNFVGLLSAHHTFQDLFAQDISVRKSTAWAYLSRAAYGMLIRHRHLTTELQPNCSASKGSPPRSGVSERFTI